MSDHRTALDEMREIVNRVCLGVGSVQEGQKLRAYIDELESRASPETESPRSVHVIMVPWCQCCAARVPVDHICACENEPIDADGFPVKTGDERG